MTEKKSTSSGKKSKKESKQKTECDKLTEVCEVCFKWGVKKARIGEIEVEFFEKSRELPVTIKEEEKKQSADEVALKEFMKAQDQLNQIDSGIGVL